MAIVARIIGLSLLAGGLSAGFGAAYLGRYPDNAIACFLLACVGGIVGAVAGSAREIATALKQRSSG